MLKAKVPYFEAVSDARVTTVKPIRIGDFVFIFKDQDAWIMAGKGAHISSMNGTRINTQQSSLCIPKQVARMAHMQLSWRPPTFPRYHIWVYSCSKTLPTANSALFPKQPRCSKQNSTCWPPLTRSFARWTMFVWTTTISKFHPRTHRFSGLSMRRRIVL